MEMVEESHLARPEKLTLAPPAQDAKPIEKEDLPAPLTGFILRNVLSPSECKFYVDQTEELGYDALTGYKPEYRNNTRIVLKSQDLSNVLYERIKQYVPAEILVKTEDAMKLTAEFGSEGLWRSYGMNEMWRFCRYRPGGHFSPHCDGYFARTEADRSMYTFMIYLNGDFDGGETSFLDNSQTNRRQADGAHVGDSSKIIASVKPEPGLALVFLHPQLHEGAQLKSNLKYILRSDIMYRREETTAGSLTDEKDVEALKIYRRAAAIEDERPMEAAELYRKAFRMSKKLADAYKI